MARTKTPSSPKNAARQAVNTLREIILARPDGVFLGSEEELAAMLGVGRATLRQTARLLEHERLLRVKRGVGGGYYGDRPDSRAVTSAAATYLRVHTPMFLDLLTAAASLNVEAARLAALAPPEADRRALAETAAIFRREDLSARELMQADLTLREHLYALARNPFLELMLRVHTEICLKEFRRPILDGPERIEIYRKNRLGLATAVLEGDAEFAAIHARRVNELVQRWAAGMQCEPLRHEADKDYWRDRLTAP